MRITCAWYPGGTTTFRNRSSKIFETWGRNLQNANDEESRYFIPDPGKQFIQIDIAGAEAVIVGYLCRPGPYRDLSIYGVKHHSYIAAQIYRNDWQKENPHYDISHLLSLPIQLLSEHPDWKTLAAIIKATDKLQDKDRRYYIGKKTGLSFNYEQGANSFRFTILKESEGKVVLSASEAERFKLLYEIMFPEIPEWQQRTKETIKRDKLVRNLYGYPYHITSHIDPKLERECIAWIPQSTVGVLATKAFVRAQREIGGRADVLNNKHDSVLIQAPRGQCALDCAMELKSMLEPTFESPYDGVKFKMKTEVSLGDNWAKWDEEKNPNGLKEIKL